MTDHITERKECWVVTPNWDRTEGRGPLFVSHVCWHESTAKRLAKGACVQGSDARIYKSYAYKLDNSTRWYAPSKIEDMSQEDAATEKAIEAERQRQSEKDAALEKARQAGLSDADIAALTN